MIPSKSRTSWLRGLALTTVAIAIATACSASGGSTGASVGASGNAAGVIGVSLITKTSTNPFFVAMAEGAEQAATDLGMTLTTASGREDGDTATQITAIENAISKGEKGILITPSGPDVNPAIAKARDAGLLVIALDT